MKIQPTALALLIAASLASNALHAAADAKTAQLPDFTYQGRLEHNGRLATGAFDLTFSLWDASADGAQVGETISESDYPVVDGIFSINLAFPGAFTGEQLYLQVSVDGVTLPRQPVSTAPVAQFALNGVMGPAGPTGPQGPAGVEGPQGAPGIDGATGPAGPEGPTGATGPEGPQGATGSEGAMGPTGAEGPTGPAGAAGPTGAIGPTGIVSTGSMAGAAGPFGANSIGYVFAGPTWTATTTGTQRLIGTASIPLATSAGQSADNVRIGMCFQPASGGSLTNFVGSSYSIVTVAPTRVSYSVSATVVPGAGTWTVGACVMNASPIAITQADFVNGWVVVTN